MIDPSSAFSSLLSARCLLDSQTPLQQDCGRFCGAACCRAEGEETTGMLLFPGEELLFQDVSWARLLPSAFCVAEKPVSLLVCEGTCPREDRPLACRLFPLTLSVSGETFSTVLDPRAFCVCPLMSYGIQGLSTGFTEAVHRAFSILWENPEQRAYLLALDALLGELRGL